MPALTVAPPVPSPPGTHVIDPTPLTPAQGNAMKQQRTQRARGGSAVWAIVITSAAGFITALDNLIVTTALPSIRKDLGGGLEDLEWTVNAYTLTYAVLLMTGAALGDRFGRKRMFVAGITLFTVASALAALAPS